MNCAMHGKAVGWQGARAAEPHPVQMGSMEDNTSGGSYAYRASKAALNAVTKSLALDLEDRGITVALLHPGAKPFSAFALPAVSDACGMSCSVVISRESVVEVGALVYAFQSGLVLLGC